MSIWFFLSSFSLCCWPRAGSRTKSRIDDLDVSGQCVCVCVCVCVVALALRSVEVLPHGLSIWLFLSSFSLCCWPRAGITESFSRHAPRNVPVYFSLPRTTTARWSLGERGAHPLAWLVRVPVVTFLTPPPAQARGQRWSEK